MKGTVQEGICSATFILASYLPEKSSDVSLGIYCSLLRVMSVGRVPCCYNDSRNAMHTSQRPIGRNQTYRFRWSRVNGFESDRHISGFVSIIDCLL